MDITLTPLVNGMAADSDIKLSKDAKKAGQDFEAVMIAQMLKAARRTGSGGWMGSESKAANPVIDMAEEQLARAMATQGAFGIAKLLSDTVSSRAEGQSEGEPQPASSPIEES
jgi:Rod binding domain-containing protein